MVRTTSSKKERSINRRNKGSRLAKVIISATAFLSAAQRVEGFTPIARQPNPFITPLNPLLRTAPSTSSRSRRGTSLNVWWFGGSNAEDAGSEEECELVAVRIERTSANSRRIAGEIIVPKPIDDVWAILTDYDNLSIHVPNLVESKQVNPSRMGQRINVSVPGDGQHKCRLYQKGAQKIVGFEFGASVTMDMCESTLNEDRLIGFKCVESQFFSVFDGEWKASPTIDPENPEQPSTKLQYVVDVRPRGPVPVTALEWRIREDVPTNLRAVKAAAIDLGLEGVMELNNRLRNKRDGKVVSSSSSRTTPSEAFQRGRGRVAEAASNTRQNVGRLVNQAATASSNAVANATAPKLQTRLAPVMVDWYEDETMGAYLDKKKSY